MRAGRPFLHRARSEDGAAGEQRHEQRRIKLRPASSAAAGLQPASQLTLAVFVCANLFAVSHLRSLRVNSSLWLATATCSSSGSTAIAKERRSVLPHTRAVPLASWRSFTILARIGVVDSRYFFLSLSLALVLRLGRLRGAEHLSRSEPAPPCAASAFLCSDSEVCKQQQAACARNTSATWRPADIPRMLVLLLWLQRHPRGYAHADRSRSTHARCRRSASGDRSAHRSRLHAMADRSTAQEVPGNRGSQTSRQLRSDR